MDRIYRWKFDWLPSYRRLNIFSMRGRYVNNENSNNQIKSMSFLLIPRPLFNTS